MNRIDNKLKLSNYEKIRIIVYYNDNLSIKDISEKMKIHRNTVSKWINRYKKDNIDGLTRIKGTGKTEKENNDDIKINVLNIIINDKYLSINQLQLKMKDDYEINLSSYSLTKILHNSGYEYGFPPKHVPLTEEIKYKRVIFATKYLNINWQNVIFSDECCIWEGFKVPKRWFIKDLGIDFDVSFKHSKKINIWGAICGSDVKSINIFTENMNKEKYVSILKENLSKIYEKNMFFQFDNDPKHTSLLAKGFLNKNKIKCLDFPPYSPDLNPIENIWGILKTNMGKRKNEITNVNFTKIIIEEWDKIAPDIVFKTINSMPTRLAKIIKNKGDYIDY